MIIKDDINAVLKKMILSASGWRGVFSKDDDEESAIEEISEEHRIICACAACVFSEYLIELRNQRSENAEYKPVVLLGRDTRPTGKAIIEAMIPFLLNSGCDIKYAGVVSAPEIMAWARNHDSGNIAGFIYVSASHNPVGHNGLKFGLTDGGVLQAEETNKLIENFNIFINNDNNIKRIMKLFSQDYKGTDEFKKESKDEAINIYYSFCNEVAWGNNSSITEAVKKHLAKKPLGIVCDFNGSARTVSIDKKYFNELGLKFECINAEPGQIAHRIVPEGESLDPCCKLLKEAHCRDKSFTLGYVPDCDGDRGNLVVFDNNSGKTRALEAQEVFALACVAELSHLVWTGGLSYDKDGKALCKAAIAVNDPTSMRIDKIAGYFGVSVLRAEVGEANVVSLARKLRENGCLVRILGEGSAGGNITHPSAVRDPLNTVLAILKMLTVRSAPGKPGFFEIWCKLSGQIEKHYDDFTLSDIISSLPEFTTTPVYSKDAVMRINTHDHALLKDRYQKIFLRERDARKDELKTRFGFCGWDAASYNGTVEKRALSRFGEAARGGLKIRFFSAEGREIAYIWMRGSATEPVFRIMADVEGSDATTEKFLLDWQRNMIMEADNMA